MRNHVNLILLYFRNSCWGSGTSFLSVWGFSRCLWSPGPFLLHGATSPAAPRAASRSRAEGWEYSQGLCWCRTLASVQIAKCEGRHRPTDQLYWQARCVDQRALARPSPVDDSWRPPRAVASRHLCSSNHHGIAVTFLARPSLPAVYSL